MEKSSGAVSGDQLAFRRYGRNAQQTRAILSRSATASSRLDSHSSEAHVQAIERQSHLPRRRAWPSTRKGAAGPFAGKERESGIAPMDEELRICDLFRGPLRLLLARRTQNDVRLTT